MCPCRNTVDSTGPPEVVSLTRRPQQLTHRHHCETMVTAQNCAQHDTKTQHDSWIRSDGLVSLGVASMSTLSASLRVSKCQQSFSKYQPSVSICHMSYVVLSFRSAGLVCQLVPAQSQQVLGEYVYKLSVSKFEHSIRLRQFQLSISKFQRMCLS